MAIDQVGWHGVVIVKSITVWVNDEDYQRLQQEADARTETVSLLTAGVLSDSLNLLSVKDFPRPSATETALSAELAKQTQKCQDLQAFNETLNEKIIQMEQTVAQQRDRLKALKTPDLPPSETTDSSPRSGFRFPAIALRHYFLRHSAWTVGDLAEWLLYHRYLTCFLVCLMYGVLRFYQTTDPWERYLAGVWTEAVILDRWQGERAEPLAVMDFLPGKKTGYYPPQWIRHNAVFVQAKRVVYGHAWRLFKRVSGGFLLALLTLWLLYSVLEWWYRRR